MQAGGAAGSRHQEESPALALLPFAPTAQGNGSRLEGPVIRANPPFLAPRRQPAQLPPVVTAPPRPEPPTAQLPISPSWEAARAAFQPAFRLAMPIPLALPALSAGFTMSPLSTMSPLGSGSSQVASIQPSLPMPWSGGGGGGQQASVAANSMPVLPSLGQMMALHAAAARGGSPASAPAAAALPLWVGPSYRQPGVMTPRQSLPTVHYTMFRQEIYVLGNNAPAQLSRWWLRDNSGRERLAVDSVAWDADTGGCTFEALPPLSGIKPMRTSNADEVETYLHQFISPEVYHEQARNALEQQLRAQHAVLTAAASAGAAPAASTPPQPSSHGHQQLAQPAALVQPGRGRGRGRGRGWGRGRASSNPGRGQKPQKQHRLAQAAGPAAAAAAAVAAAAQAAADRAGSSAGTALETGSGAADNGAGAHAGQGPGAPASTAAGVQPRGSRQGQQSFQQQLEESMIWDSAEREQVFEKRLDSVLSELALLKAQCGAEYTLMLITHDKQQRVFTSGQAQVEAVRVHAEVRQAVLPISSARAAPAGSHDALQLSTTPARGAASKPLPMGPGPPAQLAPLQATQAQGQAGARPLMQDGSSLEHDEDDVQQPWKQHTQQQSSPQEQQQPSQQEQQQPSQQEQQHQQQQQQQRRQSGVKRGRAPRAAAVAGVAAAVAAAAADDDSSNSEAAASDDSSDPDPGGSSEDDYSSSGSEQFEQGRPKRARCRSSEEGCIIATNHQEQPHPRARSSPNALPEHDALIRELAESIRENEEPYMPGPWRREPFPSIALQPLSSYVPADDCGEALDAAALPTRLRCSLAPAPSAAAKHVPPVTAPGEDEEVVVLQQLPRALSAADVELCPVWGIDGHTRRNILSALRCCPGLVAGSDAAAGDAACDAFLERRLLPALNRQGARGWDIGAALRHLVQGQPAAPSFSGDPLADAAAVMGAADGGPPVVAAADAAAAAWLLRCVEEGERLHNLGVPQPPEQRAYFRVHPKGEGVLLQRPSGLPAGAFVGEYLGELYAPWRWLERDALPAPGPSKSGPRRQCVRMGASADFYNLMLERPAGDQRGYDVLFVNAASKGNFTSRLSHSCVPNCKLVTAVAGKRLTLGVWTTRPLEQGEELTLDWACEADSERECKNAVCLCGASNCRGSFLDYADHVGSAAKQIVAAQHGFLERCRLLLAAAAEPHLSFEGQERLGRHGLRECALSDGVPGSSTPLPPWVRKWAALVVEYIEREGQHLGSMLREASGEPSQGDAGEDGSGSPEGVSPSAGVQRAPEATEAEQVAQLRRERLQSLVLTLDRAKLFLRHQEEELRGPPLRPLDEQEAVDFLWRGANSVARRAAAALVSYTCSQGQATLIQGREKRQAASSVSAAVKAAMPRGRKVASQATSGGGAGGSMRGTPSCDQGEQQQQPGCSHSMLSSGAGTPGGQGVEDPDVHAVPAVPRGQLGEMLMGCINDSDVNTLEGARQALRDLAAVMRLAGPAHAALHDVLLLYAATRVWVAQPDYKAFTTQLRNGTEGARFGPGFLWGALNSWFRAASTSDPLLPLVAERRGCGSLPEPESCYLPAFSSGRYVREGERRALLDSLAANPHAAWPSSTHFTFRNTFCVYGSPQLDAALGAPGANLEGVVDDLRSAFC